MRILVVDDEAPARERLRRLIEDLDGDYEVVGEATRGDEVARLCIEQSADLVLLDVKMPGIDGLDVAEILAGLEPPPAVILVTAYPEYALAAFERKVADYLVKPVRFERLREALERLPITTRAQRSAEPEAADAHRRAPSERALSRRCADGTGRAGTLSAGRAKIRYRTPCRWTYADR